MELKDDLAGRMKGAVVRARGNYICAYGLLIVGVLASTMATISVAAGAEKAFSPILNAVLAAIPGVVVLATSTFKFEARAGWWWERYYGLDALDRRLTFENRVVEEVSRDLTKFVHELGKRWPGFGPPPGENS